MGRYIKVICIFIVIGLIMPFFSLLNQDKTDSVKYQWPKSPPFPIGIEYTGEGDIEYIKIRNAYADGSGIYENVNYWTIYISHATINDVKEYISKLKECGVRYFSFDEPEEPAVEYVWPGYFSWWGQSEEYTVKIYLNQKELTTIADDVDDVKEQFFYNFNLTLEVIDKKVWNGETDDFLD